MTPNTHSMSAVSPMPMEAQESFKFHSKTASIRIDNFSGEKSFIQLVTEAGFRWEIHDPQTLKKPCVEKNSELEKVKQLLEKVYGESLHKKPVWTLDRRRRLREISVRVFGGSIIASVVLAVITFIWLHHFFTVHNTYLVKTNSSNKEESMIEIQTPFIRDVKDAENAFSEYLVGILLFFAGSICANFARRRNFNHRAWWYICAILLLLAAIVVFVCAPLLLLMTSNNNKEIQELQKDEYYAHERQMQGSVKFYRNMQCATNITIQATKDTRLRMNFFCQMISRLVGFLYFMWLTTIIPLITFVFCWLELVANKTSWDMKAKFHYKERTPEQIAADRSKSQDLIQKTEVESMY